MISVAIYDDHYARREGLKVLLDALEDLKCVGSFKDCSNVVEDMRSSKPDVVLMDINMPNVDGIKGVELVKKYYPSIKVIMQTIYEEEGKILAAISAGADGYILKQKSPLKLIEGIHEVLNGGSPITSIIAGKVLKLFNSKSILIIKNKEIKLTNRETEVLQLLVEGYSYKMIADKCSVSYATINTHVSHIYNKLQVKTVASAVAKALKEGLV